MVYQLAYCSIAAPGVTPRVLDSILVAAQPYNLRHGLTGVLMFSSRQFFQVLEGERPAVTELMARITNDPRHKAVTIMWEGDADARSFSDWSMGYAGPQALPGRPASETVALGDLRRRAPTVPRRDRDVLRLAERVYHDFHRSGGFGMSLDP
jgi:hypothetical protein